MMMKETSQKRMQKIPVLFGVTKLAAFVRRVCNQVILVLRTQTKMTIDYLGAGDVDAAGEDDGRHGHHVVVGDQVPRPGNPATKRPGCAEIKHSIIQHCKCRSYLR